ncbi:MAG: L,D-transpeptidase, partial [Beijerinckiaceae bacterium]|nr:L,D-transpeptidase [Beijerinckiaceae bacterium]
SRKYDWSPMPYSIFFHHGYAIHGSNEVSRLGRPASHGCIRLSPQNAAVLFELVKRNVSDTRIVITGGGEEMMMSRRLFRPGVETAVATTSRVQYTPRVARDFDSFENIFSEPPRYGGAPMRRSRF